MSGVTRVALVTGAARGIGAATVRRLVADGYRVVAVDACSGADPDLGYTLAEPADLDRLADELGAAVRPVQVDVRDPVGLAGAVEAALSTWARLDVAVAAAAVIAGGRPLWETPMSVLDRQWQVGVQGVWNTAAACVPAMLAGPDPAGARFVAVASAAGEQGLHHLAAYTTTKHAVVGLVRALAADLVGTGVTAVAVSPGSTDTAMLTETASIYGLPSTDDLAAHQLLRRVLRPEEVAATIAFCCSVEGAAVNGSVVRADGGFRA